LIQGPSFQYTHTQIPAGFGATLRAGIADRLSQSVTFKDEASFGGLAEGDGGQIVIYIQTVVLDKYVVEHFIIKTN